MVYIQSLDVYSLHTAYRCVGSKLIRSSLSSPRLPLRQPCLPQDGPFATAPKGRGGPAGLEDGEAGRDLRRDPLGSALADRKRHGSLTRLYTVYTAYVPLIYI